MDFVFGLHQPNSVLKAFGFYVIHVIIAILLSILASFMLAGIFSAQGFGGGKFVGAVVAIVYSALICIWVIYQRRLHGGYYGFVVLAMLCAVLLGGLLGMVVPSMLTTRGD